MWIKNATLSAHVNNMWLLCCCALKQIFSNSTQSFCSIRSQCNFIYDIVFYQKSVAFAKWRSNRKCVAVLWSAMHNNIVCLTNIRQFDMMLWLVLYQEQMLSVKPVRGKPVSGKPVTAIQSGTSQSEVKWSRISRAYLTISLSMFKLELLL